MKTKTAMITIAGRPNVGKSTLANALVGEKIAIVSHKPQTTRNRICAIVDRGDTQLVFIDTPGFHRPRTKLGDYMVNVVNQSVADVDAVILLVEPIANVGPQEQELIEKIKEANVPAILVINKIDTVEKENLLPVIAAYKDLMDFVDVIPISAKWHDGLDSLMQVCEGFAQEGPFMFPEGISTDMPEKQVMAEIIREKLLSKKRSRTARRWRSRASSSATTRSSRWTRRSTAKRPATRASSSAKTARCSKRSALTPARTVSASWARRSFCRPGSASRKTGATATS